MKYLWLILAIGWFCVGVVSISQNKKYIEKLEERKLSYWNIVDNYKRDLMVIVIYEFVFAAFSVVLLIVRWML